MALFRDANYELSHLMSEIEHGKLALPDIQRPFVWSNTKVRDLFDSLYRGYPVGTLMFWETGADARTRQIGSGQSAPGLLIVDGQQRLTSLFAVLRGREVFDDKFRPRTIRIAFAPQSETFEVADAAIRNNPRYVADVTDLWKDGYKSRLRSFFEKLERVETLDDSELDRLEENLDQVRDLQRFRFQTIQLTSEADPESVSDIFVRINSKGVSLKQTDFILTLMSVHWDEGRRALEAFARSAVDPAASPPSVRNRFIDPKPDQMLRAAIGYGFRKGRLASAYTILRGRDPDTRNYSDEFRDANFATLRDAQNEVLNLQNWHDFLSAISWAGFDSDRMIASNNCLLYCYVFWLIGKHDFGVSRTALKPLIGRYFFMSHTTRRYTGSAESALDGDLNRLDGLAPTPDAFAGHLEAVISSGFTPDYWTVRLPAQLDTSSKRSPAYLAYIASLNVLDADILMSSTRLRDRTDRQGGVRDIEAHHLFPRAYLQRHGVTDKKQVNSVANFAYLEWPRNVEVNDTAPETYWPEFADKVRDRKRLRRQMEQHALAQNWHTQSYSEFLSERRSRMAQVVKTAFEILSGKVDTHAAPPLPELIGRGETETLEFKSTWRVNLHTNEADKRMEHIAARTVAGFMNADGGTLVIGVDDDGQAIGLGPDLATLGRKADRDGYELALRKRIDDHLSVPTAGLVRIRFEDIQGKFVCRVDVEPSGKAVFCSDPKSGADKRTFWVRDGNATRQLYGEDQMSYIGRHW